MAGRNEIHDGNGDRCAQADGQCRADARHENGRDFLADELELRWHRGVGAHPIGFTTECTHGMHSLPCHSRGDRSEDDMSWCFLIASLIGAWFTYNAFFPYHASARRA